MPACGLLRVDDKTGHLLSSSQLKRWHALSRMRFGRLPMEWQEFTTLQPLKWRLRYWGRKLSLSSCSQIQTAAIWRSLLTCSAITFAERGVIPRQQQTSRKLRTSRRPMTNGLIGRLLEKRYQRKVSLSLYWLSKPRHGHRYSQEILARTGLLSDISWKQVPVHV